jgi:hypothetical protein
LDASRDRKRLSSHPLHTSTLGHRKRTVLSANEQNLQRGLDAIKVHASNITSHATNSNGSELDGEDANEQQSVSPLLTSPWWNRIHEDYGTHSYNFIPESRRAASSVVYVLQRDRRLEDIDGTDESISDFIGDEDSGNATAPSNSTGESTELNGDNSTNVMDATNGNVNPDDTNATIDDNLNTSSTNANGTEANATSKTQTEPAKGSPATDSKASTEDNGTPNNSTSTQHTATDSKGEEYMIISGGYTDRDWKSFPVYAFPLSSSITSGSGKWIDLSPLPSELQSENSSDSWCKSRDNMIARDRLYQEAKYLNVNTTKNETNPWDHADPCAPSGRMGHSSFLHENYLYVFGGLIYDAEQAPSGSRNREAFRLEDVPYVYRLDLDEMFGVREVDRRRTYSDSSRQLDDIGLIQEIESLLLEDDDATLIDTIENMEEIVLEASHDVPPSNKKVKGWQRIIPRVKPFESLDGMPKMAASEVLLKSVNRGEMQGGMWNGKYIMYGGLRVVLTDVASPHASSKVVKGTSHSPGSSAQKRSRIIELPLGDVWAYDLETNAFEKITNSFGQPEGVQSQQEEQEKEFEKEEADNDDDDNWWSRLDASMYPRPRTAHAATVVGDELVIHGGMGWDEHVDDWDGSTNWETLDDMWILNMKTLQWKRRCVCIAFCEEKNSLDIHMLT